MLKIIAALLLVASVVNGQKKKSSLNVDKIYKESGVNQYISRDLLEYSLKGYEHLLNDSKIADSTKLTIIDYSKASRDKRFFVLDIQQRKLLFASHVAHGKNSGGQYAKHFSNIEGSLQSSLGFFITSETYYGRHGYSMRLKGVEPRFNTLAEKRAIVMHGAEYVSDFFLHKNGRLGRSWGCPALPKEITSDVIDEIKNGTCLFIYSNDSTYLNSSLMLK